MKSKDKRERKIEKIDIDLFACTVTANHLRSECCEPRKLTPYGQQFLIDKINEIIEVLNKQK